MKRIIFYLSAALLFMACNSATSPAEDAGADTSKVAETPASPAVTMPYTPAYLTLTDDVSDADLLTVLNSYKYWENGDMASIRSTLADSVGFYSWNGWEFNGTGDSILTYWKLSRDSLSSVKINMIAWRKQHSPEKNEDWVSVWYDEVDKYKTGKVDSASYQDDNLVVNGKIRLYSQHKQYKKKNK